MFTELLGDLIFERNVKNKEYRQILDLAMKFRKELEGFMGWEEDKQVLKGMCQGLSQEVVKFFEEKGYKAKRIEGNYKNISPDFIPIDMDRPLKHYDLLKGWKHWWAVVNDKWIVDVTADQFHPGEEEDYRVVVTGVNDSDYSRNWR